MPNINIELSDEEHRVAKTVSSIYGMQWKEFFMHLIDLAIEKRGLDIEPAFKTNK